MQSTIDTRDVTKCQCGANLFMYGVLYCNVCLPIYKARLSYNFHYGLSSSNCECGGDDYVPCDCPVGECDCEISDVLVCDDCLSLNCLCSEVDGTCNYCDTYPFTIQNASTLALLEDGVVTIFIDLAGMPQHDYHYDSMTEIRSNQLNPDLEDPYYLDLFIRRRRELYRFVTIKRNPILDSIRSRQPYEDLRIFEECVKCFGILDTYGTNTCSHCLSQEAYYCPCLNKPLRCAHCLDSFCHCHRLNSSRCEFCLTFPDCIPTAAVISSVEYMSMHTMTNMYDRTNRIPNCTIPPVNLFLEYSCDYKGMKESKQVLHEAIFKELFKPSRIEAWINQGNDPIDYLP